MNLSRIHKALTHFFGRYPVLTIISVSVVSTALLYLPFITNTLMYFGFEVADRGMQYIYQNYDGILYIVPAKSWYNPKAIEAIRLEFNLPLEYYAAHLPLYPAFIALLSPIVGYLRSMILVTMTFSALLAWFFYYFLKKLELTKYPLVLAVVFLFLPRFFIIRSVGTPEPLFILLILASVFFFEKKEYLWSGVLGGLAAMTKTPGILLFVAYALVIAEQMYFHKKKFDVRWLHLLLIPTGLFLVFVLYGIQYNNFWAYFNTGGVVPMPYPFSAFNFQAVWVNDAWLEDIVLYFLLYGYAVSLLWKSKYRSIFYFPFVFLCRRYSSSIRICHAICCRSGRLPRSHLRKC